MMGHKNRNNWEQITGIKKSFSVDYQSIPKLKRGWRKVIERLIYDILWSVAPERDQTTLKIKANTLAVKILALLCNGIDTEILEMIIQERNRDYRG